MSKAFSGGNIALVNGALFWAAESGTFDNPNEKPFFSAGYPITPVNEVTEYLGRIASKLGGSFIQAESEIAAANMLIGAASVNVPAFTVTSSPGMSLMQEAISYAAGMELGGRGIVYADVARGGPGLGNIQGAQSDFNQAVLGGGHGDYQNLVLAPASAQEMFDFTRLAFKLSATYRLPGLILADGYIGQLKESYEIPDRFEPVKINSSWDIHSSIFVREGILERHNWKLYRQFQLLKNDAELDRINVAPYRLDDPAGPAKVVLVNYGIFSRIGYGVVDRARAAGLPVGQISLKSLNPFPEKKIRQIVERYGPLYVMEGSINQLHDRLRMTVGLVPIVGACQRPGGTLAEEREIVDDLKDILVMVCDKKYQAKLEFWKELYREPVPFKVNRGLQYDKIETQESSHDVEYRVGMEGKCPENRPFESMTDKNTYFCTGCDHKHSTEALGKLFDRLKGFDVTLYSPVGCAIFLYNFFKKSRVNHVQVPHGRGPAAASASKHARPDHVVICYQGDGDALDIGIGELMHAAARGENITVVLMNNGT
ncbi:MAG: thiamine pyrophosphate-dependent enzyme, partial [Candidatus Omnitrophota bacterium]